MGTNYYTREERCSACGHRKKGRHLGKSSAGWHFALRIYPEEGIRDISDIFKLAHDAGGVVDEYGQQHSVEDFMHIVMVRFRFDKDELPPHWFTENQASRGWLGLAKRRGSETGGPWDYINHEFS